MVNVPAMKPIARRLLHDFHLRPMTRDEARDYVHEKLMAAGAEMPARVFPNAVCDELWEASGGWPGILDRIALLALAKADNLPVNTDQVEYPTLPSGTWDALADESEVSEIPTGPPKLIVTNNGSVIQELSMDKPRLLIGRSEHNDISIGSRFISRHHALLLRHGSSTFLKDLNSTNGTTVNARRISNHVLMHDDVITIGHHKIKFRDPHATSRLEMDGADCADTAMMKTLQGIRDLPPKEDTAVLPTVSEEQPTLQT
jgi:hypothetical protein